MANEIFYSSPATEANGDLEDLLHAANEKTKKLNEVQKKVDLLVEEVQVQAPHLYPKLKDERDEARSFFNEYVLPVYNEIMSWIGHSGLSPQMLGFHNHETNARPEAYSAPGSDIAEIQIGASAKESAESQTMGVIPLIPIGAIAVAGIAAYSLKLLAEAYYKEATHTIEKEEAILNDPTIPAHIREKVLTGTSGVWASLQDISKEVKWTVGLGVAGLIAYQIFKRKKKQA